MTTEPMAVATLRRLMTAASVDDYREERRTRLRLARGAPLHPIPLDHEERVALRTLELYERGRLRVIQAFEDARRQERD